jgi:aspartyl-tRNA(Asn)/glutamyl-tRNA(Gln) amidotransferase subunit A
VLAVLTRFARADDGFGELKGLRVGVVEALVDAAEPGVASCVRTFVEVLEERDASLSTVDLPGWENAVDACSRLIRGEALAVYREALATRPELLEEGTRRRLSRAAELGEAELEALRHARARWDEELERRFGALDVLLTPTIPVEAPLADGADTVATTEAVVPYTFVFAFAHVPALSLPCGTSAGGAPVGVQLAAARGRDGGVLGAGAAVQAATDWHRRRAAHPT